MRPHRERIPVSEQLLIDSLPPTEVAAALCTSLGRGQLATAIARRWPAARVSCHYLDLYRAERARAAIATTGAQVEVLCTADLPVGPVELVAIPGTAQGDGELTRELLQAGFLQLTDGGILLASTDNPRDTWLGGVLERFPARIARTQTKAGTVYRVTKKSQLEKIKNYSCEFAFRDRERLIKVFSRPGVFSHRRLDAGARALITAMEVESGARVLDLGCGTGVVSLAAAFRGDNISVTALDSNPRAIECTLRSAELNEVTELQAQLDADGESVDPGSYDLALANPPYYSHFRIGEIFVAGGARALKPGGRLFLVTKRPDVYLSMLDAEFSETAAEEVRGYGIVRGVRRP